MLGSCCAGHGILGCSLGVWASCSGGTWVGYGASEGNGETRPGVTACEGPYGTGQASQLGKRRLAEKWQWSSHTSRDVLDLSGRQGLVTVLSFLMNLAF